MSRWLAEAKKEEPWKGVTIIGNYRPGMVSSTSETSDKDIDNWSMEPEHGSAKDGGR